MCDANEVGVSVGKIFPPLDRKMDRPKRSRRPNIQPQAFSIPSLFDETWIQNDKHNLFNNII